MNSIFIRFDIWYYSQENYHTGFKEKENRDDNYVKYL